MTANVAREELYRRATDILQLNDRGGYTVPTDGLYPFQWNWDSCLVSLGQSQFDEARAWTEMNTLFAHQWADGMVPHIIFHQHDDGYFPGPDVWDTGKAVPTTGISQPPVAGFAAWRLYQRAQQHELARHNATALAHKIDRWHQWFYQCRDPHNTHLVALIHPWESGRDNSIDWDEALQQVPTEAVGDYQRRDLQHADESHRPTKAQYDAYISLVQLFRDLGWDNLKLHDASPFCVVDPGFNAILIRSCTDLAALAEQLGETAIAERNHRRAELALKAMENLWHEARQQYICFNRNTGKLIDSPSVGGLMPVFANIPAHRADAIARRIEGISAEVDYLVPSHDPRDAAYDGKRYWRGPSWLIINYMIADGLQKSGHHTLVEKIKADSLKLIEESGFAEYYDPRTGEPCGGSTFTWTAAMVMEFLQRA